MWSRTQLKIGWRYLAAGAATCRVPGDREALCREVAAITRVARTVGTARTRAYADAEPAAIGRALAQA